MVVALSDLPLGGVAVIRKSPPGAGVDSRARGLGALPGPTVSQLRAAPPGGPLELQLLGCNRLQRPAEAASGELELQPAVTR